MPYYLPFRIPNRENEVYAIGAFASYDAARESYEILRAITTIERHAPIQAISINDAIEKSKGETGFFQ